uniref:Uncharacterized protein n=1 Tax=Arundo donax TaxID=35708 RepID=A0A0A9TRX8_ARUDO
MYIFQQACCRNSNKSILIFATWSVLC